MSSEPLGKDAAGSSLIFLGRLCHPRHLGWVTAQPGDVPQDSGASGSHVEGHPVTSHSVMFSAASTCVCLLSRSVVPGLQPRQAPLSTDSPGEIRGGVCRFPPPGASPPRVNRASCLSIGRDSNHQPCAWGSSFSLPLHGDCSLLLRLLSPSLCWVFALR